MAPTSAAAALSLLRKDTIWSLQETTSSITPSRSVLSTISISTKAMNYCSLVRRVQSYKPSLTRCSSLEDQRSRTVFCTYIERPRTEGALQQHYVGMRARKPDPLSGPRHTIEAGWRTARNAGSAGSVLTTDNPRACRGNPAPHWVYLGVISKQLLASCIIEHDQAFSW